MCYRDVCVLSHAAETLQAHSTSGASSLRHPPNSNRIRRSREHSIGPRSYAAASQLAAATTRTGKADVLQLFHLLYRTGRQIAMEANAFVSSLKPQMRISVSHHLTSCHEQGLSLAACLHHLAHPYAGIHLLPGYRLAGRELPHTRDLPLRLIRSRRACRTSRNLPSSHRLPAVGTPGPGPSRRARSRPGCDALCVSRSCGASRVAHLLRRYG
jgi:hypothetical protein